MILKTIAARAVVAFGALFITGDPASAQVWTQTSAPTSNWTSVASSADGSKLVAAANGSFPGNVGPIYVSTNSGASWTQTSAPITNWASVASSADGTKLVAAGYGGVSVSSDSGSTWTAIDGPYGGRRVVSSADGTRLVLSSGYRSTNAGTSWTPIPASGWCIASSADGVVLVSAYFNYNGFPMGCICISTNSGATWTPTSAPLYSWTGWTALASSADGTKLAATIGYTSFPTGPGPIYVSPDGGGTWQASSSPTSHWTSVACSADGMKLAATMTFGGIYTSTDSGATWISNSVPVASWSAVACSADGTKLVAVADSGGIWTAQSTPAPKLNTTSYGNGFVISWIVPSIDFALQQNSDLNTTNWIDVPTIPTLNDSNLEYEVCVLTWPGQRWYRLKH